MNLQNILVGWRNIQKNGIFSIINISGLSIGIAIVVLILFWIVDELSFDKSHKNLEQIYTVYEHQQYSEGQELFTSCTPFPLSQELKKTFPEIENATTYTNIWDQLIKYGDKEYKQGPVISVDSNFLKIFTFDILEGDPNALSSNDKMIISEEMAHLFFGDESAIGKTLTINGQATYTVGAIAASQKTNTSIKFKALIPINYLESQGVNFTQWGNNWPNTNILLTKGTDYKTLNSKIINLCKENGQPNTSLHLSPYKKEHLYSYSGKNNRIQYIYQFLGIAFIIILIASINFINLSISKSEQRSSEVGVRKALGANKINITRQFLTEKGIMILISILVSLLLVILFLPLFRSVSDKKIYIDQLLNKDLIILLLSVLAIVLGLSVVYPSMYLSSINPVLALKSRSAINKKRISLRSLLVVVQFVLAIILISSSIIITKQLKFINNYNLGYNHSNLIYLEMNGDSKNKFEAIKQELSGITGVESFACSDKLPFWGGNSSWGHNWDGKDPENKVLICAMRIDNNYLKTMGIKIKEGTDFPDYYEKVLTNVDTSMTYQVILNQEAIRRMGMKDPVGKSFKAWNYYNGSIVGVTEDFHFESLHQNVEPLLLLPLTENPGYIIVRINANNFSQTIDKIKSAWSKVLPQSGCEIGFFDNRLATLYESEVKISGLFKYFSFIAIFISCIGLFGLSLFIIERRKKEVGIRKVNGANTPEVMLLLNKDFALWVLISIVIATPVSWLIMHSWLENFACKTTLSWWIFALSGLLALSIALLTVSWQSWRAATRNPVESLRYE
jgi:ABC-type antimicrobial peptide transport system permease subunit